MNELNRVWLGTAPWQSVVTINEAVCQAKDAKHLPNGNFDTARKMWEEAFEKKLSLDEALEICCRCRALQPFRFYNSNTFAAVGKTLLERVLQGLPPVEAQIISSTVAHYIAGQIDAREKDKVLQHFKEVVAQVTPE